MRAEEILDRADRTACEMFAETGGLPEATPAVVVTALWVTVFVSVRKAFAGLFAPHAAT